MPATGACDIEVQFGPWVGLFENFAHRRGVKAKLGERKQPVGVNPRIRSANGFLDTSSHLRAGIAEHDAAANKRDAPRRSAAVPE